MLRTRSTTRPSHSYAFKLCRTSLSCSSNVAKRKASHSRPRLSFAILGDAMKPAENAAQRPTVGSERGDLERALGLKEAVAMNMIEMVGIAPFAVIQLVITALAGPHGMLSW